MKKYVCFIAMSFLFCGSCIAEPVWHTSTVKSIYPNASGAVVLRFYENSPSCLNTNSHKYHYLVVNQNGVTQEGLKNMLAVAMSAAALGKAVSINYDDSDVQCYINRLFVNY